MKQKYFESDPPIFRGALGGSYFPDGGPLGGAHRCWGGRPPHIESPVISEMVLYFWNLKLISRVKYKNKFITFLFKSVDNNMFESFFCGVTYILLIYWLKGVWFRRSRI